MTPRTSRLLACVASVSARVCRESWDESKCSRSNFRAITRLETLATQASRLPVKKLRRLLLIRRKVGYFYGRVSGKIYFLTIPPHSQLIPQPRRRSARCLVFGISSGPVRNESVQVGESSVIGRLKHAFHLTSPS